MKHLFFLFATLISISFYSCAQDKTPVNTKHTYEIIVPDLKNPWGFTFLPDGSILINEKSGKMILFKAGTKTMVSNLPEIEVLGQGGLMDIALHPDYKNNGWLYISYASSNDENDGAHTTILRAKLEENKLVNQEVLYKALPNTTAGQHFGSRIAFDNAGFLYFSIGDRGERDINPQDITRDGGKIYRLHDDGTIPADNPFVNTPNAKKAIYSYGHRNPQGMTKHPITGKIWTHEHGPRGGDEINSIESGKNYGWPKITYGINYHGTKITKNTKLPGMEQPIHYWDPSIAPSGMEFITSNIYPKWKDNLLVGSLKFQYLNRCVLKNNKVVLEEKLLDGLGRVRSVCQGLDGYIYVGIENVGIVKIIPKK
ncbi:PQQ-dependent sugar dehydrogenase [Lacinutrix sp. C3R15]|uniref:PQQ-dependent sugar dehydrogenase n=1 Tax=Flavobacteriaceae TaxID=49546 RepID=UPI001C09162F|nr:MULTISPECIES: PQQ-dependent sugar dehydrogenase [Flavobacteriaceae]MBU2940739.1 PQQ-dependent sugar dehydrogenase [Lacinutrix sp. C3R15]MDO6624057.1 PQQ-dependent sugar dehydrogenase [Oceanihabitans sp. 1_MG-2023]